MSQPTSQPHSNHDIHCISGQRLKPNPKLETYHSLTTHAGPLLNIWFPHIHMTIVQTAQRCRECTQQGKNLKPTIGKQHSFQMEPVVEPNEEDQLDFAGPLPDELNKDAYILVAVDK